MMCNFGRCVMICFKVIEGSLPSLLALGSQKRKIKDGHIRVKPLFIKYDETFCRTLSNFCCFKATKFLLLI